MVLTYNDFCTITEALTIVKKAPREEIKAHTSILVDGYAIIPTYHIEAPRGSEEVARKGLLDANTIKRIMRKALNNGLSNIDNGEGHLMMKNSTGKWDDFIIVKQGKMIHLKTILLQDRNTPNFKTKESDFKLVIEAHKYFDFTIVIDESASADKYFDSSKLARMMKPAYKARDILIEMNIKDFLSMAHELNTPEDSKMEGIKKFIQDGGKIEDIPFLNVEIEGDIATVVGHEGRHRATYFLDQGCTTMPVKIIAHSGMRWSEQHDESSYDYSKTFPTKLVSEDTSKTIKFPFTRQELPNG